MRSCGGPLAQQLEEEVWLMERQAFLPLNLLMKHLGYADGSAHLESALASARQIERQVVMN